jgi:4-diphosphocytidyl-2-C-methyl-D-erythritol kinase
MTDTLRRAWTAADPWPAPAKLNLFLHVVGRRADGYHLLQTVFQFLDHGDLIDLQPRTDGIITRRNALPGVPVEEDLVIRAARSLQSRTGCRLGADIRVHKCLPLGGGLGGGSSNAATVLVGLNALWQTRLDVSALAGLGLALGADVPVFVRGDAAWAEGVGERLAPVSPPEPDYLVIHPGVQVPTAVIFQDPELTRNTPVSTIADLLRDGLSPAAYHNDCEAVTRRRFPAVGDALEWLSRHGTARMSGTGACVFAAFASGTAARAAARDLPAEWHGFVATGCNRSPLLARLAAQGTVD